MISRQGHAGTEVYDLDVFDLVMDTLWYLIDGSLLLLVPPPSTYPVLIDPSSP